MFNLYAFYHRGTTKPLAIAVGTLSKHLRPVASLILRVLIYVPDSHPLVENVLRVCDFLLLLINVSSGLSEVIQGEMGFVQMENLVLLLLYAIVHCVVVMLEIIKFLHKHQR